MPLPPELMNPQNELSYIRAWKLQQRNAEAIASSFGPQNVMRLRQYARMYPWLPTGTMLAFSQEDISPFSPIAEKIANQSVAYTQEQRQPDRMKAGALNPGNPARLSTAQGWWDALMEVTSKASKPTNDDRVRVKDPLSGETLTISHKEAEERGLLKAIEEGKLELSDEGAYERKSGGGITDLPGVSIAAKGLEKVEGFVSPVVDPVVEHAIKPAVRVGGMVLNAPYQELQGLIRTRIAQERAMGIPAAVVPGVKTEIGNVGGKPPENLQDVKPQFQSDLAVAAEQAIKSGFKDIDIGSGYFVGDQSEVARERRRREAQYGKIGTHNISLGRWAASAFAEPDTKPFNVLSGLVDASVAYADPSAAVLGQVGKARQASKFFEAEDAYEAAGLLPGIRKTVDISRGEGFLDSARGTKLIEEFAGEDSAYKIAQRMNWEKYKQDPQLFHRLASTNNTQDVRMFLSEAINTGQIRERAQLPYTFAQDLASRLRQHYPKPRFMAKMPGGYYDVEYPQELLEQAVLQLRNAKLDESVIEDSFNRIAKAAPSRNALRDEAFNVNELVLRQLLHEYNIPPEVAETLAGDFRATFEDIVSSFHREVGAPAPTWETFLAQGDAASAPSPHALIEFTDRFIAQPDVRAVRNLAGKYPNLMRQMGLPRPFVNKYGDLRKAPFAVNYLLQEVWKPLQLARAAWIARVVGDEQIRMINLGYDSIFSGNPESALAWATGRKFGIGSPTQHLTPSGDLWDEVDELQRSLASIHGRWAYRPGVTTRTRPEVFNRDLAPGEHLEAWAQELAKFQLDPVYRRYMQSSSLDEFVEWLQNGTGQKYADDLQEIFPQFPIRDDPAAAAIYYDQIGDRLNAFTGGNAELIDTLRRGKFQHTYNEKGIALTREQAIFDQRKNIAQAGINKHFIDYLKKHLDSAPVNIPGRRVIRQGKRTVGEELVDGVLYLSMGKTTNFLSRGNLFKQHVWRETAELMQFASENARNALLASAGDTGIPNKIISRMQQVADTKVPGILTAEEVDLLARARSMERVKQVLFDLSERRQLWDQLRWVVPFGDAWWEVFSTWGRILGETAGKPARRLQQLVEGAQEPGAGETLGAPEGQGFFYEDPFGEQRFYFPASEILMTKLAGVPIPLSGRVQGLNMFGEVVPGIGPMATIPLAWIMQGKPELDNVRKFLLPFGSPEVSSEGLLKELLPTWMNTGLSALSGREGDRLAASTIADARAYLMSTGDYDATPASQARLMADAKDLAYGVPNGVLWIRALAQFAAPVPPKPEWLARDKSGQTFVTSTVIREYHDLAKEVGYEDALGEFIDRYGENAVAALVPSTRSAISGLPVSREGYNWVLKHPDIKGAFPLVYGFFAPQGEYDSEVVGKQVESGERDEIKLAQLGEYQNQLLRSYWLNQTMKMLGANNYSDLSEFQKVQYSTAKEFIFDRYPIVGPKGAEPPDVQAMIAELEDASTNRTIRRSEIGQALSAYLDVRAQAQALVDQERAAGLTEAKSFKEAKAYRQLRDWLRGKAASIIEVVPEFKPMWDSVFDRELIEES